LRIVKAINLAVRFLLEIAALGALGYWGWHIDAPAPIPVIATVAAPLIAAGGWGAWVAPKSPLRLEDPFRFLAELVVFGSATLALVVTEQRSLGLLYGGLVAVNLALMVVWLQRSEHD
jgi:hypothetical protein